MDEVGARIYAYFSEEAQWGRSLRRAPLLGNLEDMLEKAPDTDISLLMVHLYVRGEPGIRNGARITRNLNDE